VANKITTILDLDGSKFGRGIKQAITDIKAADGAIAKVRAGWSGMIAAFAASPAAIGAATVATGAFLKVTTDAARDLEESVNAVNTAYGTNADLVHEMGEQSAEAFGMSQRSFNQFAGQFESFAHKIAAAGGDNPAAVLEDLAGRISDFSSNKNLDLSEASRVIQSALAGETEAFRRYGGDVSAATVTQRALDMQLAETSSGLTEQDKILARYSLVMEQTNKVAGDFHNTLESQANQERLAAANAEDLAAAIGGKLTPVIADALSTMNHLVSIIDELSNRAPGGDKGLAGSIIGGAINPLEAFAGGLDFVNGKLAELDEKVGGATERVTDGVKSWKLAAEAAEGWTSAHVPAARAAEELAEVVAEGNPAFSLYVDNLEHAAEATDRKAAADKRAAEAADEHRERQERILDSLHDYKRAQLDVAAAEDRLAEAQAEQNRLLTEGKVSAEEKARADDEIADAQVDQWRATQNLADAHADLDRIISSSILTDEEKAESIRKVEDANRDLEEAVRGVDDAQRSVLERERKLAELRGDLEKLNGPQFSDDTKKTQAFKDEQARIKLEEDRADLLVDIADAEHDLERAHRDVQDSIRDVDDATREASEAQAEHEQLMRDGKNVDDQVRAALDRVTEAERRLADANGSVGAAHVARDQLLRQSIATDADKESAARNVERAELDLVTALEGQASAFANQKGAADGSRESFGLMRQELQNIIDMQPGLRDALQPTIDLISQLPGMGHPITNSASLSIASSALPPVNVSIDGQTLFRIMWNETEQQARNGWRPGASTTRVMQRQ
jgi:hypothetical protein